VKDIAAAILANRKNLDKEDTAEGLNLKQKCELMVLKSKITSLDWKRFKFYRLEHNLGSKTEYDALHLRTRGYTTICGFMWKREYKKKDFAISVCWKVNEEAYSPLYEFSVSNGEEGLNKTD
jgi:hypothetical protein